VGDAVETNDSVQAVAWHAGSLRLLDQRLLPGEERYLDINDVATAADAIHDMVVRGAPAIGITAAYAVVLAVQARYRDDPSGWRKVVGADLDQLSRARPTAVNLGWAIARMRGRIDRLPDGDPVPDLLREARTIHDEDIAANRRMGELGAALLPQGCGVLTHCNTGSLATGGYGTALGVIRSGVACGRIREVYADETRPWLQGARLTAWELARDGIPVSLIVDGAAAFLMRQGRVQWVIVGSDRIAANGDVANKIGTYSAAVAARHHGVRFMVVAPFSTVDLTVPDGAAIPIENRDPQELLSCGGRPVAPAGVDAWNPVFDITPAELVDAIVTERGVARPPFGPSLAAQNPA